MIVLRIVQFKFVCLPKKSLFVCFWVNQFNLKLHCSYKSVNTWKNCGFERKVATYIMIFVWIVLVVDYWSVSVPTKLSRPDPSLNTDL